MSKDWIVKAFHTGGPYAKDAAKLHVSAEKFGIPLDIEIIDSLGTWNRNTHYKPRSILNAMEAYPDKNIIHIDIDAWFMQYPSLFDAFDFDLGAFYWGNGKTWCSGTIIARNCERVKAFIIQWETALIEDPHQRGDQVALGKLIRDAKGINIGEIPPGYIQGLAPTLKKGEGVIAHDGARKRYIGTRIYEPF